MTDNNVWISDGAVCDGVKYDRYTQVQAYDHI